jgi:hypothetical protein
VADLPTRVRRRGDDTHRRVNGVPPNRNPEALTAAAAIVRPSRNLRMTNYEWQSEAWNFYKNLGTLKFAISWFSQTMSRVRLTAAIIEPGGEEPTPIDSGPAADLMRAFFGGPSGQTQYMRSISVQLEVPGEGYVVAEDDPEDEDGNTVWCVKSLSELRPTTGKVVINGRQQTADLWEIEIDEGVWRKLPFESHVFRQWRPDDEHQWRPDSPVRSALGTIRILDLLRRRVMAMSVSRLASNGLLLYPAEITFPVKQGFENEEDPFTAEWIDIAGKTIENPGSALAAIPLPIKVPREYIESFKWLDFANTYDERLMGLLEHTYGTLATEMNMPKEVITGLGDTNHWNAWALDEQAIKIHIAPEAELITQGLTRGYLHPALRAIGQNTVTSEGELVVWYDTSELAIPPDRSAAADAAYDRDEISGEAYRREKGFDDGDKPSKVQLREQLLIKLAHDPTQGPAMIEELTGTPVAGAQPAGPGGEGGSPAPEPTPVTGPPSEPRPTDQTPARAPAGLGG